MANISPASYRWSLRVLLLVCTCILASVAAIGQSRFTVSGEVRDAASGESLPGANIFARDLLKGTTSNTYGFFSLTLPAQEESLTVVVSFVGFRAWMRRVGTTRDTTFVVNLEPITDVLDEVEVIGEREVNITDNPRMGVVDMPIEQLKKIPALLGEVDVIKALQLLPGVQSGSEGSSGLYVRGGGPDQNLILLDGAPVYNASHLFGFFSVFNADALKNVELTKGGFPARYGGRLSSVLDISMKEGNLNEFAGQGSVGIVASKLTLEGPIRKGRTSFLISGRRTYVDLLARPIIARQNAKNDFDDTDAVGGYFFYDVNAKVNHILSPSDRLYASLYAGRDRFYYRERQNGTGGSPDTYRRLDSGLDWGNVTSTVRWNHLFTNTLFSNTIATFSDYNFDVTGEEDQEDIILNETRRTSYYLRYFSGIRDLGLRTDFDFVPVPEHYIRFGASTTTHRFSPGALHYKSEETDVAPDDTTFTPSDPVNAIESAIYLEDDWTAGPVIRVNYGVHASMFNVEGRRYSSLQPRLSARAFVTADWSVKASFASMAQYIHLLTNSGVGLPTDLWLPATDRVRPQRAWQAAVGVAHNRSRQGIEASVEGYYKEMSNLIEYRPGSDYIGIDQDWQDKVAVGNGRAYGLELLVHKKRGATTGWFGYTLSWSDRLFDELNDGKRFPYRYDRRHDISLVVSRDFGRGRSFSLTWVLGTGNAITLPVAVIPDVDTDLRNRVYNAGFYSYGSGFIYGERNGYRVRSYHRLDLGFNFEKDKRWGRRTISLGAYNTYNRKNPFYVYVDEIGDFDNATQTFTTTRRLKQVTLFPIIPSVSYLFEFGRGARR